MVKHVVNVLVVANSTGHGNTDFRHTRSVLDNHWVRHIVSPSSALSSPKKAPQQLSLARALAVENDPRLKQELAKDKIMRVDSINASAKLGRSERRNDMSRWNYIARLCNCRNRLHNHVRAVTRVLFVFIHFVCAFCCYYCKFLCALRNSDHGH